MQFSSAFGESEEFSILQGWFCQTERSPLLKKHVHATQIELKLLRSLSHIVSPVSRT